MNHLPLSAFFLTAALLLVNNASAASGNKTWNNQVVITCDKRTITLTTSCLEEQVDGLPLCPVQKIDVEGAGARNSIEYKHSINGGAQEFIAGAECFKKEDQAYLVLTATNFGNCPGCEWEDVFSPDGTYLGSTSGIYTNSGFKHKSLSRKLRKDLKAAAVEKYRTAGTGAIPRAKPQR